MTFYLTIKMTLLNQQRQLQKLAAAGTITQEQRHSLLLIRKYLNHYGRITD